jgi:thioredoxin reductase (NADPH)
MFVMIGAVPPTDWLAGAVLLDERGFVLTGPDVLAAGKGAWKLDRDPFLLETSVPGVFAAGDVRHGSGKRVATAVGEGAMAVMSVWQHRSLAGL